MLKSLLQILKFPENMQNSSKCFIQRLSQYYSSCYGLESFQSYNLHYLAQNTIIFACGNTYQIYNIQTKQKQILLGQDPGGIGSVSVIHHNYILLITLFGASIKAILRSGRKGEPPEYLHLRIPFAKTLVSSVKGQNRHTHT